MTYDLAIGDRTYSSWSLRGWLLFENFGLSCRTHTARLYTDELPRLLQDFAPARLVPALKLPDGTVVPDTLAIAETLAERHPDAGHWPRDPSHRAIARGIVAEMHSGFGALRGACPMNLGHQWVGFGVDAPVQADLDRIVTLWRHAWAASGSDGWLFGTYSVADVFFAPVAARIAGYGLQVPPDAAAYVARHLADPAFRRWRAMGGAENYHQAFYDMDLKTAGWPGPEIVGATPAVGPSENDTCPYSGKPVTHFLAIGDRTFGFCNAWCRDKTLRDPMAWPKFVQIYKK